MRLATRLLLAALLICCSFFGKSSNLHYADSAAPSHLYMQIHQQQHPPDTSDLILEGERNVKKEWVAMGHMNRQLLQVAWIWKDSMIKALKDNNKMGNIMINRVGQLWWDRKVPNDTIMEYDILINGISFHVCTFKGSAFFQTMGWYGWENWAFQGNFSRVDTFTVTFN